LRRTSASCALYPDVEVHMRQFDPSDDAEVAKVVKKAVDTYGRAGCVLREYGDRDGGGVADDVARLVLFLSSDSGSYVNRQAIAVCGGLSAGHPFVPGKLA
jgi:hypothetical protein